VIGLTDTFDNPEINFPYCHPERCAREGARESKDREDVVQCSCSIKAFSPGAAPRSAFLVPRRKSVPLRAYQNVNPEFVIVPVAQGERC
jgi:hypothetical protein